MKSVPLRVRDFMERQLLTVGPRTEITRIVRLLIDRDVSGVLVLDDAGKLVGILTERDCLAAASAAGYYDELGGPGERYMSSPVETVGPDENLVDIAVRMAGSPYRRFPVVEDGHLVGLISRRDVMRALADGSAAASDSSGQTEAR
jgi:CBS domain-containing protein